MAIRDRFEERCKCNPSGCKLDEIKGMNPVAYSVDCMYKDKSAARCDQIIICDLDAQMAGIYLVEQKRKNPSMEVVKQLQSCAKFVEGKLGQKEKFDFMPVLISDKVRHSIYKKMRETIIYIHGNGQRIERIRTNAPLKKIKP